MKVVPLRLKPGDDLRRALEAWMNQQQEQAGCVISGVGSLSLAQLRFGDRRSSVPWLAGAHHSRAGAGVATAVAVSPWARSSHRLRRAADQPSHSVATGG